MVQVKKTGKTVVLTFSPDAHDMLTMAPVRITLSTKEARDLAKRLDTGLGEKRRTSRA